ncbi:SOS response-associated peptidase [Siccirubricoccus sp. KC 17139]|uniref:Abasic site processing protein n=1 Tax=Siccirubricoccus soli TaxID=2899147 RepID=A0ABT1DBR7_9PROT|nr:SOS response-associated peptidase [Siccirubricoccus soli]MCO6418410.1 SOS response-associated peptidase [Siccirubricoccus soli]MCP2684545.1 SOS response-associated peptidase [Siccirubricoccus soli]
MCGRFFQRRGPRAVADAFDITTQLPNTPPSWNRAPTQEVLAVRCHPETGARHLDPLRWGLVPRWAKDASGAARMINARAETLTEKPAFREAFARRRCLVTADGFYEWPQEGRTRQPFAVALRDGAPIAFAGLWEGWRAPDGSILRSCTIVTTAANAKLAALHPRMPVILPQAAWPLWLGESRATAQELQSLLRPCPAEVLLAWPVNLRVNKVSENDPGLLHRDPLALPLPGLDDPPPAWAD